MDSFFEVLKKFSFQKQKRVKETQPMLHQPELNQKKIEALSRAESNNKPVQPKSN